MLDPDEKIFTSMDVKPITGDRAAPLDPERDAAVMAGLDGPGEAPFSSSSASRPSSGSTSAPDEAGKLYVHEAIRKPDLKAPTPR